MASAPERYVEWVNQHVGFNPRGQSHSDFLTQCIYEDLIRRCPAIAEHAKDRLRFEHNVGTTGKRHASPVVAGDDDDEIDPNIDGVILHEPLFSGSATPEARVTIENKTIMTAHGKARTNRYNDARANAAHVHRARPEAIAAFTIVVNTSLTYKNPDEFARAAKSSGINAPAAAAKTIELFTSMRLREEPEDPVGRNEAVFVLVIDYDGEHSTAKLAMGPPAPALGSPYSYDAFIERICRLYEKRFG